MTSTCIFSIILYKFCYRMISFLIILFPINEYPEVGLYNTILSLSQAIYLRIKSDKKLPLDIKEVV